MPKGKRKHQNPPKDCRFKPGVSGNPRGRPKGKRSMATLLDETLNETIIIEHEGEKLAVTRMEAAIRRLVDGATSGDMQAFRVLYAIKQTAEEHVAPITPADLAEQDRKIFEKLVRRLAGATT